MMSMIGLYEVLAFSLYFSSVLALYVSSQVSVIENPLTVTHRVTMSSSSSKASSSLSKHCEIRAQF